MERTELATLVIQASNGETEALLERHAPLADTQLGYLLKDICLEGWSSHPDRALSAARALRLLAQLKPETEILALTDWAKGLESLIKARMEDAIFHLDTSHNRFLDLHKPHVAAATQVSKLIALAMLGRYEDAVACGLRARDVLLQHDDVQAAARIEHNIGNVFFRRDQYREAEKFQRLARRRFARAGDPVQMVMIENSLALTLSQQHKIRAAEKLYQRALDGAERVGIITTQAAIESSIGTLALYQGQYDRALNYLERARRKYVQLDLPHLAASTEQEIADAYLELNLAPEAAEIYERVAKDFERLGMRAEAARALAYHGRARVILEQFDDAASLLRQARELYVAEGNELGAAMVLLVETQLAHAGQDCDFALANLGQLEQTLAKCGDIRHLLVARWLHGDTLRAANMQREAESFLRVTLQRAREEEQNETVWHCLNSLGLLASTLHDTSTAEENFSDAVKVIEELRAPLPAEEFRAAFLADKLEPYHQLIRLNLDRGRVKEALTFSEQARSRALVDALAGNVPLELSAGDDFETTLLKQLDVLRSELNYFYNQIDRRKNLASPQRMSGLEAATRDRELKTLEITRQLQHHAQTRNTIARTFDCDSLQRDLGTEAALVEYGALGKELFAFVVTRETVEVVRNLGSASEVAKEIEQFRFQIDALRSGSKQIRKHLSSLRERTLRHLSALYDRLIRPIKSLIGERNLIIVPREQLHYLPFHALYDGAQHLIEQREIVLAPSALVWQQCLSLPSSPIKRALLLGVADDQIPSVRNEIAAITKLFDEPKVMLDEDAGMESLRQHAGACDVLHLACHARFRPDNPLFSALKLSDAWLTVRDVYSLKLNCSLVTLSACETGLNKVGRGEELTGLARGFLSNGCPSVMLSLWTVDDEATAELMSVFYRELLNGANVAASIRAAQIEMLQQNPHPFFWAPFMVIGKG